MRKSFSNLNAPSLSDQLPSAVFSDSPAPCTPSLHQVTIPVFHVSPLAEKVHNSSVGLNSSSYSASRSSMFKASCDVVDPPVQPDLIVKEISLKPIKTSRCCSNCDQSGHYITTCPVAKEEQLKLQSDSFSLKSSLDLDSFDTPNSEDLDSAGLLLASISDLTEKPATKNSSSCAFCHKIVTDVFNGRPLLFCKSCTTIDSSFGFYFSCYGITGIYVKPEPVEHHEVLEVLAKKNKMMLWKSSFEKAKSFFNLKVVRKLCLRGRYNSGVKSIFSSAMANPNSETVQKLIKLHPKEEFLCVKPQICQFWIDNPIFPTEVANAIARLPKGKAAGPSSISFDLLKAACKAAPEISKDLANYFQQMVCLKVIPPIELTAARLIALVKPGNEIKPDGIRPIAVGESISRLFASIVFNRVVD
ncbi:hypothetical protein GEMRC1_005597 [Eukaryota sp. GEM-RC1]